MSKRVLILTTSARRGGNSEKLAQAFAKGAQEAGNEVTLIRAADKHIECCRGCLACQQTRACAIRDDMAGILKAMMESDVLCFATPIYFYAMSGLMKTILDRTNPLFPQDYPFRDVYLLASAADTDESACRRAVDSLEGWIECFPETRLRQVVFAPGVTHIGDAEKLASGKLALAAAFRAGRNA